MLITSFVFCIFSSGIVNEKSPPGGQPYFGEIGTLCYLSSTLFQSLTDLVELFFQLFFRLNKAKNGLWIQYYLQPTVIFTGASHICNFTVILISTLFYLCLVTRFYTHNPQGAQANREKQSSTQHKLKNSANTS